MERLNWHLIDELSKHVSVHVIGPAGAKRFLPESVEMSECPLRPLPLFLISAFLLTLARAIWFRPHMVIAGSGLMAPMAFLSAKMIRSRSVVYVHGLDIVASHKLYRKFWLPFISKCDVVLANSRNTAALADRVGIHTACTAVVPPGTSVPEIDHHARARFRRKYGFDDRPVLLSVGRLTARKGLADFVEHILPIIVRNRPNISLVIIGGDAKDALGARKSGTSEKDRILHAARKAGVDQHIKFEAPCSDQELSDAYFGADVHVFPVIDIPGDVEGFGMVCAEAAAHGLLTVGNDVGGVSDAVIQNDTGCLVTAGDHSAFAAAVTNCLRRSEVDEERTLARKAAAKKFSWSTFSRRLESVLEL